LVAKEFIMTVDEVMQYRRAVPFKPFVLALKDGRRFVVSKPEEISRNSAFTWISVAADEDSAESFNSSLVSHVEVLNGSNDVMRERIK
jgi:hypothetical protein